MESDIEFLKLGERVAQLECQGEYVLPDYLNDVKKILAQRASIDRLETVEGEQELGVQSTVRIAIAYLDREDKPSFLEFDTDLDHAFRWDASAVEGTRLDYAVDRLNIRLMGPRKISAKAYVTLSLLECKIEAQGLDAQGGEEPEVKTERAVMTSMDCYCTRGEAVSEELAFLDGAIEDEVRVLWYWTEESTVRMLADGRFGSDITVYALVVNGEEFPSVYTKSIPFEGVMPEIDQSKARYMQTKLYIEDFAVKPTPTDSGVGIALELTPKLCVTIYSDKEENVITDGYYKSTESIPEYTEVIYTSLCGVQDGELAIQPRLEDITEEGEQIRDVPVAVAEVKNAGAELVDGELHIKGNLKVSGMACQINCQGDVVLSPIKCEVPFDQKVNNSCQFDTKCRLEAEIGVSECKILMQGTIPCLDVNMNYTVLGFCENATQMLTALKSTDSCFEKEDSVVTVYYLNENDSLFSVAKTFHTSCVALARDNSLSAEVFASVDSPLASLGIRRLVIK